MCREDGRIKTVKEGICKYSYVMLYCPNCGKINAGQRNSEGVFKSECPYCKAKIISIKNSRRHDTINIYAPAGQISIT